MDYKSAREALGLDQKQLADLIGYSEAAISRLETHNEGGSKLRRALEKALTGKDTHSGEEFWHRQFSEANSKLERLKHSLRAAIAESERPVIYPEAPGKSEQLNQPPAVP